MVRRLLSGFLVTVYSGSGCSRKGMYSSFGGWALLCGYSGLVLGTDMQTSCSQLFPLGPGPEALPCPEPLHGQPGHVQQRTSQLLPLLKEIRASDTDDGESQAVSGVEWVQTEPCTSEASTTHFMGETGEQGGG